MPVSNRQQQRGRSGIPRASWITRVAKSLSSGLSRGCLGKSGGERLRKDPDISLGLLHHVDMQMHIPTTTRTHAQSISGYRCIYLLTDVQVVAFSWVLNCGHVFVLQVQLMGALKSFPWVMPFSKVAGSWCSHLLCWDRNCLSDVVIFIFTMLASWVMSVTLTEAV